MTPDHGMPATRAGVAVEAGEIASSDPTLASGSASTCPGVDASDPMTAATTGAGAITAATS
jgi:hypothetical protein